MSRVGVEDIASKLRSEIVSSGYKRGDRLPSSAQVLERFGSSPVTCMKAYKILEREGLVDCIQGKGVFLKDDSFKSTVKRVGLLSMEYGGIGIEKEVAFGQFMNSAADELRRSSRAVIRLMKEDLYSPDASSILEDLDALVASVGCIDSKTIPLLEAWGRPVVVLQHEDILPYAFHQVVPDLRSGYREAVDCFIKSGTKRLTLVCNPLLTHDYRIKCMIDAIKEHPDGSQIELGKLRMERLPTDLGRLTGREIGERMLKESFPREAIFSPSDFLAFGILDSFLANGLRPGVDFKLIGYDNLEGAGMTPYGEALLSSVDFPRDRIARTAVRMLFDIEKSGEKSTRIVRIPCHLITRKTT